MAEVTLALRGAATSNAIEEADLLLPLTGAWSATARLADPDQPTWQGRQVMLTWMGQDFQGTVDAEAIAEGKTTLFIVGGAGKLLAEVPAKHYQNASGQLLLQEACQAAGEQFTAARIPQPAQFSQFPRRRAVLADVLDDLARAQALLWGVLPTGKVWLGVPPWDAAPAFDSDHIEEDGVYQTAVYELRAFGPLPGQTLDGRRVGCCSYTARQKMGTRLQVWFTPDGSTLDGDPLRVGLRALIKETLPLVWLAKYPGAVRAVRGNGTWDVQLDEKRMPPLVGVRPRVFAPGAKIMPPVGSRVEVSFEQGDPRYPVAELFEAGSGDRGVARKDDTVQVDLYYTTGADPDGGTFVQTLSATGPGIKLTLQGKITSASDRALLP